MSEATQPEQPPDRGEAWTEIVRRPTLEEFARAFASWGAIPATDRYGDLKKIKHRTLVVNGKDDIMVPTINS
jgi:hypothetical protein